MTDDTTTDETGDEETSRPPMTVRFTEWVASRGLTAIVAVALLGALVLQLAGIGVPRWAVIIGISALLAGVVIGRPAASRAEALFSQGGPDRVFLVDVDAADPEHDAAIYVGSPHAWREWSVTDGSLEWASPTLAFGKHVDLEAQTVEGVWRGTLSDRELLTALNAVRECRDRLEDWAKVGHKWELNAWAIVREATVDAVRHLSETFERSTLPDEGDGITDAIDARLEDLGLERDLDALEDDDGELSPLVHDLDEDLVPDAMETDDELQEIVTDD